MPVSSTVNGVTKDITDGTADEILNATPDETVNGILDKHTAGNPNGILNGITDGIANGNTINTTNALADGPAAAITNGTGDGRASGTAVETTNGIANGGSNGAGHETTNGEAIHPNDAEMESPIHIIIIGAGLTGLLFAQGIRKLNANLESQGLPPKYTYCVYERDPSQFFRGGGFSLTIHWGLDHVCDMLMPELSEQIYGCTGNKFAMDRGEMGYFTYLNLRTGQPLFRVPVPKDWKGARMNRVKFIKLLMTDLNIKYSKRLSTITFPDDDTVCARFEDGESITGDLLIGADGSRSAVRHFLYGKENSENVQLPIRMINTRVEYPLDQLQECLAIDPHTFHGGDPEQNGYFLWAWLDLPSPESKRATASVQMTFAWPYEAGYLGEQKPTDPQNEHLERLKWLQRTAEHWTNPLGDLIRRMPEDSFTLPVTMAEWLPSDAVKRKTNGRVTMVGDSAHLMTSCKYISIPSNHISFHLVNYSKCLPRLADG
ncbi:MAG: hypothetical protein Q9183_005539 [Haloplaca sp. 2 TL-2023]